MLRAPRAWRVDRWPQEPGEQSWEPHEGPLVTRQDSGQEFLGTDQGSSSFFATFVCWPPLYFVQRKTTYLRFCPRSGGGGCVQRVLKGQMVWAVEQHSLPAHQPCCFSQPDFRSFSSAPTSLTPCAPPPVSDLGSLCPTFPHSIKCNKLNPSPRGAGSELSSSPSPPPQWALGSMWESKTEPEGLQGWGEDRKGLPPSSHLRK